MKWFELIGSVLGSSIVATVCTQFFITRRNNTNNSLEYITKERSEWRKYIRDIALDLQKSESADDVDIIYYKLSVRLNPWDDNDKEILDKIKELKKQYDEIPYDSNIDELKIEIVKKLSELLKEDWDRVKCEAKGKVNINMTILVLTVLNCLFIFCNKKIFRFFMNTIKNNRYTPFTYEISTITLFLFKISSVILLLCIIYWVDKVFSKYSAVYRKKRNKIKEIIKYPHNNTRDNHK